ncbi:hypothetical protein ACX93W_11650 [Paenibacillus sp. CAU 1782]
MPSPLTEKEVNRLVQLLNEEQSDFLQNYLKQGKKSKWLEKLAHKKGVVLHPGISIDEVWQQLNDWELNEIVDGGYGNRPYKCECGKALRFCYVVHHRKEHKTYRLGETCLGNYTMMSAELIKDITDGFHKIDLERDGILLRYERGWELPGDYSGLPLTEELKTQIIIGLPLSSIQENRIEKMFKQKLIQIRRQKKWDRLAQMRNRQPTYVFHPEASNPPLSHADTEYITYEEVVARYMPNLNAIRESENKMTDLIMLRKWNKLQNMISDLKQGRNFDHTTFLSQMFELLYYLKLY